MTLEQFIKKHSNENELIGTKYTLEVLDEKNDVLKISIKTKDEKQSEKLDFYVVRNKLIPTRKNAVRKGYTK